MPIFHRLAHDFENVFVELRHFVEEQDAVVRERDFTRTRGRPAANEAGVGDRVMRRAIRPCRDQRCARGQMSGDGMNLGRFERFAERHVRQDGREPAREHRLTRTRRADHDDIVPACRGDFEGALRHLLPLHIGEVDGIMERGGEDLVNVDRERRDRVAIFEELHSFLQRRHGIDIEPGRDCRLARILNGDDDPLFLLAQCAHRNRQDTMDRLQLSIEREFADENVIREIFAQDLPGRGENADRHRQVESRSLFLDVRGREVNSHFLIWVEEVGVTNRGGHALIRLTHRGIGQTDGDELRERGRYIRFNINEIGINP